MSIGKMKGHKSFSLKCQNHEDFANFCSPLRKPELYLVEHKSLVEHNLGQENHNGFDSFLKIFYFDIFSMNSVLKTTICPDGGISK